MPTRKLAKQQRDRYDAALSLCFGGMTALDMMLSEYGAAGPADDRAALELEDLAARIGALTACWTPADEQPEYTSRREGSRTGGDYSHSG